MRQKRTARAVAWRVAFAIGMMLGLGGGVVRGHDSLQSTDSFWLRPTGLQVEIYMARSSAETLIEGKGERMTITVENFSEYGGRLAEVGKGLISVLGEDGTGMRVDSSSASITEEEDVCFSLHYPTPGDGLRGLKIHGNYLGRMTAGHVGAVYVLNGTNDLLGSGEMTADAPNFEMRLAEVRAGASTKPAATLAANADAATIGRWEMWCLLGGSLLALAFVGWRVGLGKSAMRDGRGR